MGDFKFGVPGPPGSPWGFPGGFASAPIGQGSDPDVAEVSGPEKLARVSGLGNPLVRFTEIVSQVWNSLVRRGQLVKRSDGEYEVLFEDDDTGGLTGTFP